MLESARRDMDECISPFLLTIGLLFVYGAGLVTGAMLNHIVKRGG